VFLMSEVPLEHPTASERRVNNLMFGGLLPGSQGQNLALTVLCVPYSLDGAHQVCDSMTVSMSPESIAVPLPGPE